MGLFFKIKTNFYSANFKGVMSQDLLAFFLLNWKVATIQVLFWMCKNIYNQYSLIQKTVEFFYNGPSQYIKRCIQYKFAELRMHAITTTRQSVRDYVTCNSAIIFTLSGSKPRCKNVMSNTATYDKWFKTLSRCLSPQL